MIFVVGGAFQGKHEFAETFGLPVIKELHKTVKELIEKKADVMSEVMKMIGREDCVVVCNDVGCGIVPAEKEERDYREIVGRVGCAIAKKADEVYLVEAGITQKIK